MEAREYDVFVVDAGSTGETSAGCAVKVGLAAAI
jgi:hypothetical protein